MEDLYRVQLEIALEQFKQDCLGKYDRGRETHKDDLMKLDCQGEIYNEILDLVVYTMIKKAIQK
jgi:hypothetical protein